MLAASSAPLTGSETGQKRLGECWNRAAGGEKGNGMGSPFRRVENTVVSKRPVQSVSQLPHSAIRLVQLWSSELIIHPAAASVV